MVYTLNAVSHLCTTGVSCVLLSVKAFDKNSRSFLRSIAEAEGLNFQLSPDLPSSIYIAIFALYWVSFAASAFAMQVTTFTYFRKFPDLFLAFVSWMATGALFIIFIIVVVAAAKFKEAAEAVSGASGEIGNSTWMVLGAMIASFIASVWYSWNYLNRRGKSALDTFKY